jgi:hypothetical protein
LPQGFKVPRGFFSVIGNVCRRDAGIAAILREQKYAETEAELQYVLNLLAVRIYEFFATIFDVRPSSTFSIFSRRIALFSL